jgi:uncharacterized phage protein (TIGR01671 family)
MNRQIKFRVWNKPAKCFIQDINNEIATFTLLTLSDYLKEYSISNIDHLIFQQYTGLNDLTGKEIYEGDLVELHTDSNDHAIGIKENHCGLYEIYWDRKYKLKEIKPNWFLEVKNGDCANFNIMKVVGNVFENKELLK